MSENRMEKIAQDNMVRLNDLNESPNHRIISCPNAKKAWELLDEVKGRLGLHQLTDHTLENIIGAKDEVGKIELALQAELLLKLISRSDGYDPVRLVDATVKVISYCERLNLDLRDKFGQETNRNR